MSRKVTLHNKFHGSSATVISRTEPVYHDTPFGQMVEITLSEDQVRRADKKLCGMICSCGGIDTAAYLQDITREGGYVYLLWQNQG